MQRNMFKAVEARFVVRLSVRTLCWEHSVAWHSAAQHARNMIKTVEARFVVMLNSWNIVHLEQITAQHGIAQHSTA